MRKTTPVCLCQYSNPLFFRERRDSRAKTTGVAVTAKGDDCQQAEKTGKQLKADLSRRPAQKARAAAATTPLRAQDARVAAWVLKCHGQSLRTVLWGGPRSASGLLTLSTVDLEPSASVNPEPKFIARPST